MFEKSWIEDLKNKINIVDVIKNYVNLQRDGSNFKACCPFHSEKTPSFKINVKEQYYKCFGCGKGGDVISFIMEKENFTYPEALRFLAEKYNMPIPKTSSRFSNKEEYSKIYEINKEAATFYHKTLLANKKGDAYRYLISRGIDESLMVKFGLGYSPGYEELHKYLSSKGYSDDSMKKAGLINQKLNDLFAFRLIIPIVDFRSRVIAFGGRAIKDGEQPKYRNSNNNLVFDKSKALYNIDSIRKSNRKENDFIILVEGYMDVISLSKYNISNCVASMGTALTIEQSKLIKKYADKVFICYDGDSAGQNATLNALDILKQSNLEVFAISLPEGNDPDDYISTYGVEAFNDLINNAAPLIEYKIRIIKNKYDMETAYGREAFAKEAITILENLNPIEQESAIKKISELSSFSINAISATFKQNTNKDNIETKYKQDNTQANYSKDINDNQKANQSMMKASLLFLSKFFLNDLDFTDINVVTKEYFEDIDILRIYNYLKEMFDRGLKKDIKVSDIFQMARENNSENLNKIANKILEMKEQHLNNDIHTQQYAEALRFLKTNYDNKKVDFYMKQWKLSQTLAEKKKIEELINEILKKQREDSK